jgi:hypothetical protein
MTWRLWTDSLVRLFGRYECILNQFNKLFFAILGFRRAGKGTKDDEEMFAILNEQLNKLKSQNAVLSTKLTQATEQLEKRKREVTLLKKTSYLKKSHGTDRGGQQMELEIEPAASHLIGSRPTTPAATSGPPNLLDVAKKYKER